MLAKTETDQTTATLASIPAPPSALDMLRSVYLHHGPYTSLYLQASPLPHDPQLAIGQRWDDLRLDLGASGAPAPALDAIEARLSLPAPDDAAGMCVIAAADGHTVVDHSHEPPRRDFGIVDTLPYAAPLLEWEQRRVPHLVVTVDRTGADVIVFGGHHRGPVALELTGSVKDLAYDLTARADALDARLVLLAGEPTRCQALVTALTTAGSLGEFRVLASHEAAVDGTAATVEALTRGMPDVLLIQNDPTDQRRIWVGDDPRRLSTMRRPGTETEARFVDAAIRSAVARDVAIHIIPSRCRAAPWILQ